MPARDVYHNQCKAALVKDGWRITDDPLSMKWGKKDLHVDLGAEEVLAAEKQGRRIAVEIKSLSVRQKCTTWSKRLGSSSFIEP